MNAATIERKVTLSSYDRGTLEEARSFAASLANTMTLPTADQSQDGFTKTSQAHRVLAGLQTRVPEGDLRQKIGYGRQLSNDLLEALKSGFVRENFSTCQDLSMQLANILSELSR